MEMMRERALIWAVTLLRVTSWLRLAISQSRTRTWSRTRSLRALLLGLLLDDLFVQGDPVLVHVDLNTGFGFDEAEVSGSRPTASAARRSVMVPERIRWAKAIS